MNESEQNAANNSQNFKVNSAKFSLNLSVFYRINWIKQNLTTMDNVNL